MFKKSEKNVTNNKHKSRTSIASQHKRRAETLLLQNRRRFVMKEKGEKRNKKS